MKIKNLINKRFLRNHTKIKAITSLTLLILFIIVFISGIALFLAPSGRIAKETSWIFLGINKWQWEKIHTLSGYIFSGIIIWHLFLNYKLFLSEIKTLFKKKF